MGEDAAARIRACDYPWNADDNAGAVDKWTQDTRAEQNKLRR